MPIGSDRCQPQQRAAATPNGVADGTRRVLLKTTTSTSLLLVLDAGRDQSTAGLPGDADTILTDEAAEPRHRGADRRRHRHRAAEARQQRWPWRRAHEQTPSLAQLVILAVIPTSPY
jgi:hypothetical protein